MDSVRSMFQQMAKSTNQVMYAYKLCEASSTSAVR